MWVWAAALMENGKRLHTVTVDDGLFYHCMIGLAEVTVLYTHSCAPAF